VSTAPDCSENVHATFTEHAESDAVGSNTAAARSHQIAEFTARTLPMF
jgi:hypothetical protein